MKACGCNDDASSCNDCVQPGRLVFALSDSQPGSWLHAKPLHERSAGKHLSCAHLVQPLEVGLRQSQTHFDFVQLASDTQHEAHEFEKPRFCTQDSMHEVPEMMHRTAQLCTEL